MTTKVKSWFDALKEIPIGASHSPVELRDTYRHTVGGVSWPTAEMEGFALVLGLAQIRDRGVWQIYLVDEFQHEDTRELIAKMGAMQVKYKTEQWIGDSDNQAASKLRWAWNDKHEVDEHCLYISRSPVLDFDRPYEFLLPQIKQMQGAELWLKKGEVTNYMHLVNPSEVPGMKIGDNPAVEALGYAVMGMQTHIVSLEDGVRPSMPGGARPRSPFAF